MKARKKSLKRCSSEADPGRLTFEAKILPRLLQNWLRVVAQCLAINGLKKSAEAIRCFAQLNEKKFFIELGKALSVKTDETTLCDPVTRAVVDIISKNPSISAKDALRELGRPDWTEETFRERRYRLKRAIREAPAENETFRQQVAEWVKQKFAEGKQQKKT
jgi:hypothetical protein